MSVNVFRIESPGAVGLRERLPDADISMPDYVPEPGDTWEDAYFAFCALFQDALSLFRSRISGCGMGIDLVSSTQLPSRWRPTLQSAWFVRGRRCCLSLIESMEAFYGLSMFSIRSPGDPGEDH